jgi:glucose/arabinose dehydrogenase
MKPFNELLIALAGLIYLAGSFPSTALSEERKELHVEKIQLPAGFKIELFADHVPDARSMTLSPSGTLFVGTREEGKVYAIPNAASGKKPDKVLTLAEKLNMPNGVAFKDGSLYVAEINRILRFDNVEEKLKANPNGLTRIKPAVIYNQLPSDRHHGWKFIAFGPDGYLYIPIGAPCNVCEKSDPRYASITRIKPDGTGFDIFAKGIRNTVGFDWDPKTHELWFTDNGRDLLGNLTPPDELDHAPKAGMNFGFPKCLGDGKPDPELGKGADCSKFTAPVQELSAHTAALGMRFYRGKMFPSEYQGQIFIAEHGSWNRQPPFGYRITRVRLSGNKAAQYAPFAEGWLQGAQAWGRPVDVQELPDGSLLVSDDDAGVIYRITYRGL